MQPYEGSHQLLQIFASMMALGLQESGCRLLWLRDPFDRRAMPQDALRHLAETARLKKLDAELEVASAVERDVDSIRRARDRQNLALLRAEADLGITDNLMTSDL